MTARHPTAVVRLPVSFRAETDRVVAVFQIGENSIGVRFESPDELLSFCSSLLDTASRVWPENRWVKEYLSEEN